MSETTSKNKTKKGKKTKKKKKKEAISTKTYTFNIESGKIIIEAKSADEARKKFHKKKNKKQG